MDLSVLAASVVTVLAPYVAKSTEEFAKEAGKQGVELAKTIYDKIQQRWSGRPAAERVLEGFTKDPKTAGPGLEAALELDLEANQDFARELRQLLEAHEPVVRVIQRMESAKRVTGADVDDMSRGRLEVGQDMKQAEDVTGATIKRLGS